MSREEVEYTKKWARSVKRATRKSELLSLARSYSRIARDTEVDDESRKIARRRARLLRHA